MSYCKQLIQGDYSTTVSAKTTSYLQTLRDFLLSQGFTLKNEDYTTSGAETLTVERDILGITFNSNASSVSSDYINIQIYVNADDETIQVLKTNGLFTIKTLQSIDSNNRSTYAFSSTIMTIDNNDSFMFVISPSSVSINTNTNIVAGVVHYNLLDSTQTSAGFYSNSATSYTAKEKTLGDTIVFANGHITSGDDTLIYEPKLSINKNSLFTGDTEDVIGLVGAGKGKTYQTSQGKYFAFYNNMAMPMGEEVAYEVE